MNFAVGIGGDHPHRIGDVLRPRVLKIDHDLPMRHCLLDRRHDVGIGAAAADVSTHQFADFVGALRFAFGDQAGSRADLARRAIAALERVMVDEGLLQRMQRAFACQTFDGDDLGAVLHYRERKTGIDPPSIHQHRARATLAVVAALFGAGEVEVVPKRVEQRRPRRRLQLPLLPVDIERNQNLGRRWAGRRCAPRCSFASCRSPPQ